MKAKKKNKDGDLTFTDYLFLSMFCLVWDLSLLFIPMLILRFIFGVEELIILLIIGGVFLFVLGKYIDTDKITKENKNGID